MGWMLGLGASTLIRGYGAWYDVALELRPMLAVIRLA